MPEKLRLPSPVSDLASGSTPWFFFDGTAAPEGETRVSYLGQASEVLVAESGREQEFFDRLRARHREAQSHRPMAAESSPGRFRSGWVVTLSYEFGLALHDVRSFVQAPRAANTLAHPSAIALRIDAVAAVTAVQEVASDRRADHTDDSVAPGLLGRHARWRTPEHEYEDAVVQCQAAISRGDAHVLCLTDTAEVTVPGPYSPLGLFARLREMGPATRGGVIVAGDRALVSMSPERFLSVEGGTVSTHPIKGTRRRGTTPDDDVRLAAELLDDPKERSENLMIVDLMHDELGKVCDPGSVRVTRFLNVETHPSVHQLVSSIEGDLATGNDVFDAIAACFPGGSMVGAPKTRAAEILAGLESKPRGLYSGCFGWIDDSGDAELAMTIRGVELRGAVTPGSSGDVKLLVGAGGGITADSVPKREREERDLKAEPLLAAL